MPVQRRQVGHQELQALGVGNQQPRSADATAIEQTICLVLPRTRFDAVARMRSIRLEASGLDTVRLVVGMLTPGADVEKAWSEAAEAWKTEGEMRRKAIEGSKEAPKDLKKNPKK